MNFPTDLDSILARIDQIDPEVYARTRNYLDGAVTRLSPYLSRGVLSTRMVAERLAKHGWKWQQMEKLVQELAWRDYWQLTWKEKGAAINEDLRKPQPNKKFEGLPAVIRDAATGIEALDAGIRSLMATGYLHNHLRMYVAMLCTSIGHYHWREPARWMYYYLLDADWASNALSWQWVCGANSNKIYIANQENINRYTGSRQVNSYLDTTYEALMDMPVPESLQAQRHLEWTTLLPSCETLQIDLRLPTMVYHFYQLDPFWKKGEPANRVLLLEPEHFRKYPVHARSLDFALALGANIPGLQVFVGSFAELQAKVAGSIIHYKEHPLVGHYEGICSPRDWLAEDSGDHPSFFRFWKRAEKRIRKNLEQP